MNPYLLCHCPCPETTPNPYSLVSCVELKHFFQGARCLIHHPDHCRGQGLGIVSGWVLFLVGALCVSNCYQILDARAPKYIVKSTINKIKKLASSQKQQFKSFWSQDGLTHHARLQQHIFSITDCIWATIYSLGSTCTHTSITWVFTLISF